MIDDDREWLENGSRPGSVLRPEIANSWRRSRLSGVSPDTVAILPGDAPLDSKIARVAVPVLSSMAEVLIGANTSLLLSAPDGTMLWRWDEDSRLSALLDRNSAVVGTRWSEDVVGTNGLGTSLETAQAITIHGSEHFAEALHPFTCAGAAIRHPITRRVAGTLSVTSLNQDASPLMAATLLKLVREVEEQLYGASTLRERELLHHFLAERRRADSAVVVVNGDTVIANKAGAKLGIDHRSLWNQVAAGRVRTAEVVLERSEEISWRAIEHAGSVVGLVIVADPPADDSPAAASPGGLTIAPRTPHWSDLPARLRSVSRGSDRFLVTGESGVGKRTLVQETFGSSGPLPELDGAEAEEVGSRQWLAVARELLTRTVEDPAEPALLLSHLESLTLGASRSLGRILDGLPRSGGALRVIATWTPTGVEAGPALQSVLDRFASEPFEVPPLRRRPQDITGRLVDQGATMPVLSPAAVDLVERHPWPGNHRQLEEFRRWIGNQRRPVLDVADLPARWSRDAARAGLTAIQAAEADAISASLSAHDGNKAATAAELGISRSSLYRKMREFHLT
ncbi:sigma-54-dependent Fis family transcriptional regulator [Pseudonocardia abyssalis]|uniref:GAF domain-containing protein n=1 Tax=Pseudonocardia abyssalis TaxID=2792008 RepID=A0ABS6ULH5_9PSEU|nr:helix-turn-helix domain-containing protein [Pseudonocardia abyssalis]MBW0114427.1 GAF domain-containing protein [Pseudonocardia abyssalis]MBW0133098.1 GAF domain-containing protein [Pseudonocardia abyssalis]